jgi:hypothetical protein
MCGVEHELRPPMEDEAEEAEGEDDEDPGHGSPARGPLVPLDLNLVLLPVIEVLLRLVKGALLTPSLLLGLGRTILEPWKGHRMHRIRMLTYSYYGVRFGKTIKQNLMQKACNFISFY